MLLLLLLFSLLLHVVAIAELLLLQQLLLLLFVFVVAVADYPPETASTGRFRIQKQKETTGRVVFWNMGITCSYTMEV